LILISGNYTNEFGDRSDAENRGILFNNQIPGLRQAGMAFHHY
jgi:hypothetical protein